MATATIVYVDPTSSNPSSGATATIGSSIGLVRVNDKFIVIPLSAGKSAIIKIEADAGL